LSFWVTGFFKSLAQGQNSASLWLDPHGKLNRDAQYKTGISNCNINNNLQYLLHFRSN